MGRRYGIIGSGTYCDKDEVEDFDDNEEVDLAKDYHHSPKLLLRDRLIIRLNAPTPHPPLVLLLLLQSSMRKKWTP